MSLPGQCYSVLQGVPASQSIILIRQGQAGYFETAYRPTSVQSAHDLVNELNQCLGVSQEDERRMVIGSLFGWPAACLVDRASGH